MFSVAPLCNNYNLNKICWNSKKKFLITSLLQKKLGKIEHRKNYASLSFPCILKVTILEVFSDFFLIT